MNSPSDSLWPAVRSVPSGWQKLVAVMVIFAFLGWNGIANAQPSFNSAVDYNVGQGPDGIASGDFDGDDDIDIAVVSDGPAGNVELIEIFLNNSDGTYAPGSVVFLPNSSSPTEIVAADLDGDMDVDLAVILRDFQQIQVVTNNGAGAFALGGTAAVGDRARGMTSGDYDSDFDIDLAVANRNDNTATILTNNGAGVFSSTTLAMAGEPRAVTFVDIDGNVDLDVAVTNNDDRNVALFTNTGAGFLLTGTISIGQIHRPEGIVSADLDGNGQQDLAVAVNDDVQPDGAVVFLNQGGSFGPGTFYLTNGTNTSGILAADLDCDGSLDLATRNEDSNDISLLPNLGGIFGSPTLLSTGLHPSQMVASDVDNDGDMDIAVSNRDSNTFSVLLNNCGGGITPLSFLVITGSQVSGDVAELAESDDQYLVMNPQFLMSRYQNVFTVDATAPTDTPSALEFTYESKVFNIIGTVDQRIELFNYPTGQYETVDNRLATTTDSVVVVIPAGDPTRFVEAGTGAMRARIGYQNSLPFWVFRTVNLFLPFRSSVDQILWTVTP